MNSGIPLAAFGPRRDNPARRDNSRITPSPPPRAKMGRTPVQLPLAPPDAVGMTLPGFTRAAFMTDCP